MSAGVNAGASIGAMLDALATRMAGPDAPPARQEARDLIAAVLDVPRFWPTAHRDRGLSSDEAARIEATAERLARGMPLAYAARRAQFRALSLYVDERVLIPRPETELLVELALAASGERGGLAIDAGTGSGNIALALATEGRFSRVIGTDVSADAVAVARENAARLAPSAGCTVEFLVGEWLVPCLGDEADVVVSNPPYISTDEIDELPPDVRDWEPHVALFAEDGGMAAIAAIAAQAARVLRPGGVLALEVDSRRAGRAAACVEETGAYRDIVVRPDLTGRARFVLARRMEE